MGILDFFSGMGQQGVGNMAGNLVGDVGQSLGGVASQAAQAGTQNLTQGFDWNKFFTGGGLSSLIKSGGGLLGAIDGHKALNQQMKISDSSLKMAEDAYRRDTRDDDARQRLQF